MFAAARDEASEIHTIEDGSIAQEKKIGIAAVVRCSKEIDGELWQFDLAIGDCFVSNEN